MLVVPLIHTEYILPQLFTKLSGL